MYVCMGGWVVMVRCLYVMCVCVCVCVRVCVCVELVMWFYIVCMYTSM
jgi:hypothetical protein